ncbi:MAG: pyruvate dehydrogenase (acetyl-transferring) E1 component subunit alpha [Candidatus Promineifilaceae bacterium]
MANTPTKDKATLLDWYQQMIQIRRFEERCDELYQLEGKIKGFLHLYIGQEAIAVGTIAARHQDDHLITTYRDHGHALAVGLEPKNVFAELMGKAAGVSGGRGGSMHLADASTRFWGGYGIVGAHLSLATGLGLAESYKGTTNACLCYFGEGSSNIGYFHESFNMSRIWDLPILWICENNKYGMGTSIERASASRTIIQKGEGYNIPSKRVDGMNIIEVFEETTAALNRIRNGEGPQLLEMMTYRYEGHSIGDRTKYRSRKELDAWRDEKDAIKQLRDILMTEHDASAEELDSIDVKIRAEMDAAVAFADAAPLPGIETLYDHIYPEN